jgi:uncharacterized protein (TIGR02145 family)
MKRKLLKRELLAILAFALIAVLVTACKDDDEKPKTVPVLTTSPITDISTTSATGGGEITSNGNAAITATGLVYSSANGTPTIADSKTEETATNGSFSSALEGLTSGTIYHVRAYATNSVGTGYGNVMDFTTGNIAPSVTDVVVNGEVSVGDELTAAYVYNDPENDDEGATTFQWYRANDNTGTGELAISSATGLTYTLTSVDLTKFIRVGVTPKSSTGTATGVEIKSTLVGPVVETVTFTYNGESVTYGVITSSVTSKKWLDRNLGAQQVATATNDYEAYGDLFQWGRSADGHQIITWTGPLGSNATGVNGTTTTLATANDAGTNKFIIGTASGTQDWRDPINNNLWQGTNAINTPCPTGWHVPTAAEWEAEIGDGNFTGMGHLLLSATGYRDGAAGTFSGAGTYGYYVTSDAQFTDYGGRYEFNFNTGKASGTWTFRSEGNACRCIKDE